MTEWAVVTGASSGIGREIAIELSRRGYACVLVARSADTLASLAQSLPTPSLLLPADLTTAEGIHAVATGLPAVPDILVNAAGMGTFEELWTQPVDEIRKLLELNINGLVLLTRALLPEMVAAGRGRCAARM